RADTARRIRAGRLNLREAGARTGGAESAAGQPEADRGRAGVLQRPESAVCHKEECAGGAVDRASGGETAGIRSQNTIALKRASRRRAILKIQPSIQNVCLFRERLLL